MPITVKTTKITSRKYDSERFRIIEHALSEDATPLHASGGYHSSCGPYVDIQFVMDGRKYTICQPLSEAMAFQRQYNDAVSDAETEARKLPLETRTALGLTIP